MEEEHREGEINDFAEYLFYESNETEQIQLQLNNIDKISDLYCFLSDVVLYGVKDILLKKNFKELTEFPLSYLTQHDINWINNKLIRAGIKLIFDYKIINSESINIKEKIKINVNSPSNNMFEEEKEILINKQIDLSINILKKNIYEMIEGHDIKSNLKDYMVIFKIGNKLYNISFDFVIR
jgi:hypothetical protein